jgi:hypothetical protein
MDVFNVNGKLVYSSTFNEVKNRVELNNFSSGIYTVRFTSNRQSAIKKIVVN